MCHLLYLQVGIPREDIGVIAPYRGQVLLLQDRLGHSRGQGHGEGQGSHVEVNTVDQYQGRDKNVIIISFVMSSSDKAEQVEMGCCRFYIRSAA